jgi:hypothetical protein
MVGEMASAESLTVSECDSAFGNVYRMEKTQKRGQSTWAVHILILLKPSQPWK